MRLSLLLIPLIAATILPGNLHAQISSDDARAHLPALENDVRPSGSYLGVRLGDIDADRAKLLKLSEERGVEITNVEEDSPAARAGLKTGDVVLNYNGENILGAQQFVRLVQETPQGRRVKMQYWRDGKPQTTVVTTGAPPKSRFDVPPNFVNFNFPEVRVWTGDTPTVVMAWRNSLLGVECESLDSQLAQFFGVKHGVLVRSVGKGSAAEKAGIKAGDVLTAVGDRTVVSAHDITSYDRSVHEPGKPVAVSLVRDHKPMTVTVVPPENQQ